MPIDDSGRVTSKKFAELPKWKQRKKKKIAEYLKQNRESDAFMKSAVWKNLRAARLEMDGGLCARCGGRALRVHRVRFPSLDKLSVSDLESVCLSCFEKAHVRLAGYSKITPEKRAALRYRADREKAKESSGGKLKKARRLESKADKRARAERIKRTVTVIASDGVSRLKGKLLSD